MSIGKRTPLDALGGMPFRLMGANVSERVFRLRDDEGNEFLFQAVGDKTKITDVIQLPADTPLPRGCGRDEPIAIVHPYPYNKRDNINFGTHGGDAQWNRGYLFVDGNSGHVWLRIGTNNYKSTKSRALFQWNAPDDLDDEEAIEE